MSILTKFSIFATLLILLVVSSISLFIFVSQRRLIIDDLEAQRENAIAGVVSIAKESILTRDDILLLNYVNFIKKNTRALLTCMVVDNKNFIIAHSNPEYLRKKIGETIVLPGGKKIVVEAYSLEPFFEPTIRMSVPVMVGTKKIAKVHMEYSNKALRKIINDNLILIGNKIMLSGGITLLLGIFISYVFAHTMTGPVLKLAEGAHLIGEGNLDTKLKLKTHDELGYLAEEFNKMAQKLKELDRMKDDFVSSVTHELRSPLAAIESYVNLMLDNPQELLNKGSEHLIRIKNNTARLGRFIDDLLDVAKIESGTMFIKKEKINIYPVLLEICSFFQLPAREKGIKLEMNLVKELPLVNADPDRIRQVMINLINNALKFTPSGGTVTVELNIEDNKNLVVSISDTGPGIDKKDAEMIFQKFYQVRSVTDKTIGPKGTGLGLSIVKGIIDSHGGEVHMKSTPGKGSKFYFTLPIIKS